MFCSLGRPIHNPRTDSRSTMTTNTLKVLSSLSLLVSMLLLPGCIAFPPLVQVEHKHGSENQELMRRLDSIDHRLNQLEQRGEKH
jgi:hypothetical protein